MSFVSRTMKSMAGRCIWRRRDRSVQTLLDFARTEAGGALDIQRAADSAEDPGLRRHLQRHAEQESDHATLFRQRAREIHAQGRNPPPSSAGPDLRPLRVEQRAGSLSLTDHGFLSEQDMVSMGELRTIAMLYVAECQAREDFRVHRRLTRRHDPDTAAVFQRILEDEEYHVAYTRAQLRKWEEQGRGGEVKKALREMRWKRIRTNVSQGLQRFGFAIGQLMLTIVYFTLFLPFGLVGWIRGQDQGWMTPDRPITRDVEDLRQP